KEWYHELPAVTVAVTPSTGNCGYATSNCCRATVEPLRPVPGKRPANGLGVWALRKSRFAWSRSGEVERYCRGMKLRFCEMGSATPRLPTYAASSTNLPGN